MTKYNAKNERTKRNYLSFLGEAKQQCAATLDDVAAALARFENYTNYRDFKAFHHQQAVGFKKKLSNELNPATGKPLSKATQYAILSHLKRFFEWLATQPGYKSTVNYPDAEYFNMSGKDSRIATARRQRPFPTLEQVQHAIRNMPTRNELERRDQALLAFILLSGVRDGAAASLKLNHVDIEAGCVNQDAREVNTKFSKTYTTYFFPVGEDIRTIVTSWIEYLQQEKLWGQDDPLFPKTKVEPGSNNRFEAVGLQRAHWKNATPIRKVFRKAFESVGLPYFNPHSFRNTLVNLGERRCQTAEEFKAWSQNLGHERVLTTFLSYGSVSTSRQGEILHGFSESNDRILDGEAAKAPLERLLLDLQDPEVQKVLSSIASKQRP